MVYEGMPEVTICLHNQLFLCFKQKCDVCILDEILYTLMVLRIYSIYIFEPVPT